MTNNLNEGGKVRLKINKLIHPSSKTNQLLENVSLWLGEISNGIDISAKVYNELQQVNLTYNYIYGDNKSNEFTPLNVGFGITYVLPIIVAVLKSKPDDLLIIENPESHLHPAGQSKIAELCAIASSQGVQIIIETHSDHFLNGIRVATKKEILKPESSQIYYFRKEKNELEIIDKEETGKFYPKNFFGDNINVTAIVGENGSGKSSVMEFLLELFDSESSDSFLFLYLYENKPRYYCYKISPSNINELKINGLEIEKQLETK